MTTMNHSDPDMQKLWSPMSREGHARFATLRAAIRSTYAPPSHPPSHAQRLQDKYAAGARRSGDAIFFETFGTPEQLLRMGDDDELCAELFAPPTSSTRTREPEPEPEPIEMRPTPAPVGVGSFTPMGGHVSRLAKPTRMQTPKRFSLKRPRADDESSEMQLPVRKPRLSDTTNLLQTSTTTMNPWDRYHHHSSHVRKPSATTSFSRLDASPFQPTRVVAAPVTTSAFASRPQPNTGTSTSTRAFALR